LRRDLRIAVAPVLLVLACTAPPPALPPAGNAGAGGGDGGSGAEVPPACRQALSILPEDCVNFGSVVLGLERTFPIQVSNPGDAPVEVCTGRPSDGAFSATPTRFTIPAGGDATVEVQFFPGTRGEYGAELPLSACTPCPAPLASICLRGEARVETFRLAPDAVNFGAHAPGTSTCQDITVENTGDIPIYIRDIRMSDGLSRDRGAFKLELGNILNNVEIAPGASETFQLCFTPSELGVDYAGSVAVTTDNETQSIAVAARASAPNILALPERLDLDVAIAGRPVQRRVVLTNVGEVVREQVTAVEWTTTDGALRMDHPALPYDVGEDGDLPLDVTFTGVTSGAWSGSIGVTLRDESGNTNTLTIPVTAKVIAGAPCTLDIQPGEIAFGMVRSGKDEGGEQRVYRKDPRIRNTGSSECLVWHFALDPDGSRLFSLEGAPAHDEVISIAPGAELVVSVAYAPLTASIEPDASRLIFERIPEAGADSRILLPISAFGSALCLTMVPNPIDFGQVPLGSVAFRRFSITNCGTNLIKIGGNDPKHPIAPEWNGDVAFSSASTPELSVRGVPEGLPFTLPAGVELELEIVYDPTAIGIDQGHLEIWLKNAAAPLVIDVFAQAVDAP
jgi:hypothetical protein